MLKSLSLQTRIYLSMMALLLLSFVLIGAITVYHFKKENEEYHQNRLLRKERAIMVSIDYFLEQKDLKQNPDSVVKLFTDKICELADINGLDINIYNLNGELLISSHTEYFKEGYFVFKLPSHILERLKNGEERVLEVYKADTLHFLSVYRYIKDSEQEPIAIINIPYLQTFDQSKKEIREYLITLSQIYFVFFIIASIIVYFLTRYITGSLKTISDKLKEIDIGKKNEPLIWESEDEIGMLVKEYNRMLKELEKSAELLAKSERESAWREMAKQVAHEIKNPLTPMKLNIQLLQRAWKDDAPDKNEKLQKVCNMLIEQIDTLSDIASAFSGFAKMPPPKLEVVNVEDVIASVVDLFSGKNMQISVSNTCAYSPHVLADRKQLQRVFINILKNAEQATETTEGKVSITVSCSENRVTIAVADNGKGIPQNIVNKVFEPNFTTKSSGSGLGLAMAKGIVEQLKGKIYFETEPGKGTVFFIELPVYNVEKENV